MQALLGAAAKGAAFTLKTRVSSIAMMCLAACAELHSQAAADQLAAASAGRIKAELRGEPVLLAVAGDGGYALASHLRYA